MNEKHVNSAVATPEVSPEILLFEETRTLPETMKLVLLGVARGMALSADMPRGDTNC